MSSPILSLWNETRLVRSTTTCFRGVWLVNGSCCDLQASYGLVGSKCVRSTTTCFRGVWLVNGSCCDLQASYGLVGSKWITYYYYRKVPLIRPLSNSRPLSIFSLWSDFGVYNEIRCWTDACTAVHNTCQSRIKMCTIQHIESDPLRCCTSYCTWQPWSNSRPLPKTQLGSDMAWGRINGTLRYMPFPGWSTGGPASLLVGSRPRTQIHTKCYCTECIPPIHFAYILILLMVPYSWWYGTGTG